MSDPGNTTPVGPNNPTRAPATPTPPPVPPSPYAPAGSGIPTSPASPGVPGSPAPAGSPSFIGALFDFSFSTFVTPMLVKAVYILATVVLCLLWVFWIIGGFSQSFTLGLVVLIIGPAVLIIYLAIIRMTMEFYLAVVRMSEDIHQRLR